ncbi:helix-turn-helix domain-containing protein [Streptomyces europaeiscabiei]|uniref:Helix-turn-helix transcriptional regulator n=1 Tax=Streptomyces europaeiscabiei TaxID=146819 RepID=A0ABU4NG22_9ACTN|nr:helix-turn-helix transcriptional regulator [Streptomyces europaeiscabiei]MDX2529421.1 helix-turn-helix transcriptional regulator [Streptomyces europaeiscabiei]MDX2765207.1 helix-turn-helix transcriptional regulator [Streptomyces europaeiscabiei]MDX2774635.1 helix-turn-helix transcriptional regulator [Streptomyces europaeiscabiei]MDX3543842.1 helix-turn-helix transcriptional regulator [Streptomyces europaeiscabiei]MDX3553321.1 helix-turn-helix transcriptional regulator [Streptomyces europaei
MARDIDPSLNRRRLRIELRKARESAGLTQRDAAQGLEWSLSKLIRIEAGTVGLGVTDLRALLQQYRVTDASLVVELEEAARGSKGQSWWAQYSDLVSPQFAQYLGYEGAANTIRMYNPIVLPGLLQTEDYATALLSARTPEARVRRQVELRTTRQERSLDSDHGPEVDIVLDEASVRRVVGGPAVMRRQLERVKAVAQHPRVSLQLLPFSAGAHYGTTTPFILLGFKDDDDLLYIEGPTGGLSNRDDLALTARYQECFEDISSIAYRGEGMIEALDAIRESLDND